jgi:hypothetical protein
MPGDNVAGLWSVTSVNVSTTVALTLR